MSLDSLEFELPLFSLIFFIILIVNYYAKKRINIVENKYYNYIIVFSFVEIFLSTIVHFICALNSFTVVEENYYVFINYANKLITTSFVGIFTYLLFYVFIISFPKYKQNIKKLDKYPLALVIIFFILTHFTNVILMDYQNVTNVSGSTPLLGYIFLAPLLMASFIISIINIKKIDKRYYAILIIIPLMTLGYITTIIVPGIIIYDIIITILCYIMFFTMENPDMTLLEELHKSKEISDTANEEKTLFLYNMTQEIRSITSKIDNDADGILDTKDYDEIYDNARDIKSNTTKFSNITNEILDVDSIDESNLKIYNNKYNIKTIIKQLVNVYSEICNRKELKFITNFDNNVPESLYGDSINIKEVLNNVLDNSVKYTEKGFIEFDLNTIIKNDICRLIFTIEDSGKGIKSEDINKIKLENKSLSKTNQLITAMSGTMMISSDFGGGTKVKIILDQKIENTEDKEVIKYEENLRKLNILAIDDSEAGLKIITKLLRESNISLDIANNGKDAIEMIKVNKYDIILLDEELSSISGQELLKQIIEIRNFNTPVILLTKDNNYEYNEEYLNEGFTDYILKPIKKNTLLEKINKYTSK